MLVVGTRLTDATQCEASQSPVKSKMERKEKKTKKIPIFYAKRLHTLMLYDARRRCGRCRLRGMVGCKFYVWCFIAFIPNGTDPGHTLSFIYIRFFQFNVFFFVVAFGVVVEWESNLFQRSANIECRRRWTYNRDERERKRNGLKGRIKCVLFYGQ